MLVMHRQARAIFLGLAVFLLPLAGGCGPAAPPPLVPAEGVVMLDGQPLPNAMVTFAPQLSQYGAEMNSWGITDDQGKFQLTCMQKSDPGALAATHKVTVTDAPPPAG